MMVQVLLFAQAREIAGHPMLHLEVRNGAVIRDVKAALAVTCPELGGLLPYCMFSIDQCYVGDGEVVTANSEIGCIPPVSGG